MKTPATEIEIFANLLTSICRRMGHVLQRAAYSVYVKHTCDFSVALMTPEGETIANSYPQGVPNFVAANARQLIARIGLENFAEGDVYIANDPYTTGGLSTHLPDICLLKPIFWQGELLCFAWCFIHCSDVGGAIPGSIKLSNTEIFQEGLRIAPRRLYSRDGLDRSLLDMYLQNSRTPDDNYGDVQAGVSALNIGAQYLIEAIGKYGIDTIRDALVDVIEWSQMRAERALEHLEEGRKVEFVEFLDDDGVGDIPVRMKVTLWREGRKLVVDWAGTDPQVESAINLITQGDGIDLILTSFIQFFVTVDPDIPLNGGLRRPLEFRLPQGSLMNPQFPAAGGARGMVFIRALDLCAGALSRLAPHVVPAANGGVGIIVNLSEPADDSAGNRRNMLVLQALLGGAGARPDGDGVDVRGGIPALPFSNSVEVLESECSITVTEWGDRVDSGGAGRFRGGNGFAFEFKASKPNTIITARGSGRLKFPPWGRAGGRPGRSNRVSLRRAGEAAPTVFDRNIDWLQLGPGDVLRFETPGGGGFGQPARRDEAAVLHDLEQGYISAESARRDYGLEVADGTVAGRHAVAASEGEFDFGEGWERFANIGISEGYEEILQALFSLPLDYRGHAKRQFFGAFAQRDPAVPLSREEARRIVESFYPGLAAGEKEFARAAE